MIRRSDSLIGTQLNSVWLEGVIVTHPVDLADQTACQFRIQVPQASSPDPPSVFLIEASESALDGCRPQLDRGRSVRIIGRLRQHRWKDPLGVIREEVTIVGEMVEPASTMI